MPLRAFLLLVADGLGCEWMDGERIRMAQTRTAQTQTTHRRNISWPQQLMASTVRGLAVHCRIRACRVRSGLGMAELIEEVREVYCVMGRGGFGFTSALLGPGGGLW